MGSTKDFVYSIMIGRIILNYENIAFKGKYLLFGFTEKILQKLFIIDIKIITHRPKVYTLFMNSQD